MAMTGISPCPDAYVFNGTASLDNGNQFAAAIGQNEDIACRYRPVELHVPEILHVVVVEIDVAERRTTRR